jgi:hypothetical protein
MALVVVVVPTIILVISVDVSTLAVGRIIAAVPPTDAIEARQ